MDLSLPVPRADLDYPDTKPPVDRPGSYRSMDHLRRRHLAFHVPLNEWRIDQYVETFVSHFQILKQYVRYGKGENLLRPEIENEFGMNLFVVVTFF